MLALAALPLLTGPARASDYYPTAAFTVEPLRPSYLVYAGESAQFDGTLSHDNDENESSILSYRWELDGAYQSSSSVWTTTFALGANGADTSYVVELGVMDDENNWAYTTITVRVREQPTRYYYVTNRDFR